MLIISHIARVTLASYTTSLHVENDVVKLKSSTMHSIRTAGGTCKLSMNCQWSPSSDETFYLSSG